MAPPGPRTSAAVGMSFWFRPCDPTLTSLLRIGGGLTALLHLASYSGDLVRWFAADGLLPTKHSRFAPGWRRHIPSHLPLIRWLPHDALEFPHLRPDRGADAHPRPLQSNFSGSHRHCNLGPRQPCPDHRRASGTGPRFHAALPLHRPIRCLVLTRYIPAAAAQQIPAQPFRPQGRTLRPRQPQSPPDAGPFRRVLSHDGPHWPSTRSRSRSSIPTSPRIR